MTDGAVIGDVGELIEVADRHAAPRLLLVEERLDQERRRKDLVARRIEQVRARHVRRAHGLALAAAQAVLDRIGDRVDVRLLHDERLVAHQIETRRIGVAQIAAGQELAAVEMTLRVDAVLVAPEIRRLRLRQELELRDADAVFARDHAIQAARDLHDAFNRAIRLLEHLVVVGIDRNVRMHVAVAGVHVQSDPHATAQDALMDRLDVCKNRCERCADEQAPQVRTDFRLPGCANGSVLHQIEHRGVRLALQSFLEVAAQRFETEPRQLRQSFAQS